MNPWLLLVYGLGWLVVVIIAMAILVFVILFILAAIQTVRQERAVRAEQARITSVSILSSQANPDPEPITRKSWYTRRQS